MQTALVIITFTFALGYLACKVRSQFTAKGCEKGCGGSCQKIEIPNKR
ncbi:MAG: hypothetical protein M0D57_13560 [Sphingobacteriales bacterium JAD_PAG50586_3]|nr:MAG: hypothetical protein M0D57_13560 [Sphingobacteriales bacterium JAD_PAG50586_3]